jgi:hypothetical protein
VTLCEVDSCVMIRGLRTPMRNAQVGSEQNEFSPWRSNKSYPLLSFIPQEDAMDMFDLYTQPQCVRRKDLRDGKKGQTSQ